jgi:hypothetical protein
VHIFLSLQFRVRVKLHEKSENFEKKLKKFKRGFLEKSQKSAFLTKKSDPYPVFGIFYLN